MRGVSLFSGAIDGLAIAFEVAGIHVTHHVEWDAWCCDVLRRNFPASETINRDIAQVKGSDFGSQTIDVLFGSPPCQGFSVAGKQAGFADERYLWPEMYRLVRETHPTVVLVENVRGSVPENGDNLADAVLGDLESEGYTGAAYLVPANLFGAPHERYRVFIVAYTTRKHGERTINARNHGGRSEGAIGNCRHGASVVNSWREGLQKRHASTGSDQMGRPSRRSDAQRTHGLSQRGLGRITDGAATWMDGLDPRSDFPGFPAGQGVFQYDYEPARTIAQKGQRHYERLEALGNAVVWQQALPFAEAIAAWLREVTA